MDYLNTLIQYIQTSKSTVFFGGAGTSTESNVPDFRSKDGLYSMDFNGIPPEKILSHDFFFSHTALFYEYLKTYLLADGITPHKGHHALVALEKAGMLDAIITQNIDNLHQEAGSKIVYELHGSLSKYHCTKCHKAYTLADIKADTTAIPTCDECHHKIKPDVVLYQEGLNEQTIKNAIRAISSAEVLIVCGTSLVVYPAAGFLQYFNGKHLILINRDVTPYDQQADLVIRESFGDVFDALIKKMLP